MTEKKGDGDREAKIEAAIEQIRVETWKTDRHRRSCVTQLALILQELNR